MIYEIYRQLKSIAENEFGDIVTTTEIISSFSGRARKLRINIIDGTFVDIWYSVEEEYSFHWEQRGVRDAVYRHDNAPHRKWSAIKTFPKHCHNGTEQNVSESYISDEPEKAVREFLKIVREKLLKLEIYSK
ncbi:MAG: hypothetical protein GTO45_41545 [Candidatus Aminicenantes bacterium]|nr:hypothetical protein [Candidatus Aminicenantes bacterium]NIM85097.1 hypothetical protein [Candidatus Aminicenantes bacterium]NIN24604.1 hypothetical protein [Candidatus Aminicenantes bacterium]NIN48368.1 hypothetical protein [Candidatus Aminicenantes bacterium]NIN91271.1 hypothetical protein [Candidatus Aminicenantes bacterium]